MTYEEARQHLQETVELIDTWMKQPGVVDDPIGLQPVAAAIRVVLSNSVPREEADALRDCLCEVVHVASSGRFTDRHGWALRFTDRINEYDDASGAAKGAG